MLLDGSVGLKIIEGFAYSGVVLVSFEVTFAYDVWGKVSKVEADCLVAVVRGRSRDAMNFSAVINFKLVVGF